MENQVTNTYTKKYTYLLPLPFPMEKITLGETRYSVLNFLYKGNNPYSISKLIKKSIPTTREHLFALRNKGLVKKGLNDENTYGDSWFITEKGKVLIEKCVGIPFISSHKDRLRHNVRGHGHIWKIKPNKSFDWLKLIQEQNIHFIPKGLNKTPRITLNNKKVWLGKNYITIFLPKTISFFERTPSKSRNNAVYDMVKDIEDLQKMFHINFNYKFTCRRQHYGFVDNPEAKFFMKNKRNILIKNEKGYWFSIDFSQNKYKEAEILKDNEEVSLSSSYQDYMNSHERTKFKVTPEFILTTMNGIQSNQVVFDKNISKHQKVLDEMLITLKLIQKKLSL